MSTNKKPRCPRWPKEQNRFAIAASKQQAEREFASQILTVRVKPPTIMIGDVEVPEPMRNTPELEAPYWLVDLPWEEAMAGIWKDQMFERRWLRRGLLQATEQGAKEMLDALIKQLGGGHE